ncbi:TPA: hypothetical protein KKL65_004522 [Escherichia coli]|nr:hypothetical protein [Escherichia coli]
MNGKRQVVEAIADMLKEVEARLLDPSEVSRMAMPDFDALDKALLLAISLHPEAAIECGLLCPVADLLSYAPRKGTLTAKITNLFTSRYGHGYRKLSDGYEPLQTHTIVAKDRAAWPYTGYVVDGYGDYFDTNDARAKGSIMLHTLIGYFPGLELPRAWSKMFDAERNQRGGDFHPYRGDCVCWVDKAGYVKCGKEQFGKRVNIQTVNHVVDHIYGNTDTLQPGFRAALQLRTILPDVNHANKHPAHAVGDFLCFGDFTGYQPSTPFHSWDDLIWQGWQHMMNQANQPVGGFRFKDPALWCLALSK